MARGWTAAQIPDLQGRRAVVTGSNSGLGYQVAVQLARHGARVVLTSRDRTRGAAALARLRRSVPQADVSLADLDLADLASVRRFAEEYRAAYRGLDLLINNAGVMAIPRRETADGFEMQLGTNHLGHFALTGLLLPALLERPGARVVTVSSGAHHNAEITFDDLQRVHLYKPWAVYGQSKLANLLFAFELDRRARAAGLSLISVAAHPGYAATNLQGVSAQMTGNRVVGLLMQVGNRLIAQSAAQGARPLLYAATAPDVQGGAYYGPDGFREMRGYPTLVATAPAARDQATATRLWQVSQELTGVHYAALDTPVIAAG